MIIPILSHRIPNSTRILLKSFVFKLNLSAEIHGPKLVDPRLSGSVLVLVDPCLNAHVLGIWPSGSHQTLPTWKKSSEFWFFEKTVLISTLSILFVRFLSNRNSVYFFSMVLIQKFLKFLIIDKIDQIWKFNLRSFWRFKGSFLIQS